MCVCVCVFCSIVEQFYSACVSGGVATSCGERNKHQQEKGEREREIEGEGERNREIENEN